MEFATGAFGTLLPKLAQLLEGEYKLQKNVRKNIESLKKELEYTHAALRSVGEVPPEEVKEVVSLWARDARELSYDMEDVVDTFLVHVQGPDPPRRRRSKRFIQKMKRMLAMGKSHQIGEQMEDIMKRAMDVAARRDRYKDDIDNVSHVATLDPRITALFTKANNARTWGTRSMPHVRSAVVFSSAINQIPALQSFKVLRVLDLQGCNLSQGYSLKYLGSLFHLRYLNLRGTRIDQLPKEVENLQFLETLDIQENNISHLQLDIAQFKHLLCLLVDFHKIVSNGIWSLKSLEELSWLHIDDELTDHIEELGLLTELRVLRMILDTDKWNNKMTESLSKLRKIQTLCIYSGGGQRNVGGLDAWVAPGHLRILYTGNSCWFSRLPAWMNNPTHLADLCKLYIAVRELEEKDLNVLGRLPALTYLSLLVDHESLGIRERFVVGAGSFPCLVYCLLTGFIVPVVFQNGAAPRLTRFDFDFHVREVREIAGSDGGFDLGLQNLPSLQRVDVSCRSGGASKEEVEEAKAAVRKAAEIHPNNESWTGRLAAGHVQGHHLGGSAVPLVLPQHEHHGTRDRQDRRHALSSEQTRTRVALQGTEAAGGDPRRADPEDAADGVVSFKAHADPSCGTVAQWWVRWCSVARFA
ncbi:hypothetical protein EJB05_26523 [Eragrostis curvula]|uniref:Uncharacterized protein n=1 Tax=Eragrostis curvula TaxID=38414 RepID=A0A5J9UL29_9POAL|nr:hypothetical protein EJB05_26523 [Eragrostis curvula]